ncbi:hypothetical protein [Novosphingobium sp.]|uniref:hypothetical protein n=1 Tax=Novosphingobium sp. TaxID=1874826 RepID=UPI002FE3F0AA
MGARMLGVEGIVQREGEVIHVIARKLVDLAALLSGVGRERNATGEMSPLPHGRGDGGRMAVGRIRMIRSPSIRPPAIYSTRYAELGITDLMPSSMLCRTLCKNRGISADLVANHSA